ncbi:MAG: D-alanine--D-alanine ligase [Cyclobacteriaceae bacterium]
MRIGIFFGGQSREREISFAGGRTVYDNLNKSLFEPVPVFIDSLGNFILLDWQYIYKGTIRDFYPPVKFLPETKHGFQVYLESLKELTTEKQTEIINSVGKKINPDRFSELFDFAFLALHGPYGEDGSLQGILEWYGIPYSGSGILPSAIGINKVIQKDYFKKNHFPDPDFQVLKRKDWLTTRDHSEAFEKMKEAVGLPMVIKAPNQGSSIGIGILENDSVDEFVRLTNQAFFLQDIDSEFWLNASDTEKRDYLIRFTDIREGLGFPVLHGEDTIYHPEELWKYLDGYFSGGNESIQLTCINSEEEIIIESFIKGKEFSCIVIEGDQGPIALPPTEIVKTKDLFDYRSKYLPGISRKVTPIDLPSETVEYIRKESARLNESLYCHVYARIDGFYSEDGNVYLIDPNTTSGMMPSSFFFHQAGEIGLNPSQFLTYIIRTSLESRVMTGKDNTRMRRILEQLDNEIASLHDQVSEKIKVAVILGGYSTERHISVESGRNIYQKLSSSEKYEPIPVFLTGDENHFELYQLPVNILLKDNADDIRDKVLHFKMSPIIESIKEEAKSITEKYVAQHINEPNKVSIEDLSKQVDAVFIALHGRPGEDGALQAELDKVGLPYNGSGVKSSQISIDKYRTKEILKEKGFTVANHLMVTKEEFQNDATALVRSIETTFQYPFIAKPSDDGCSSAVKKIKNRAELEAFTEMMFRDSLPLPKNLADILHLKNSEEIPLKTYFMVEDLITAEDADHFLEVTGGLLTRKDENGEMVYEIFEPSEALATGEVLSLEEKFLAGEGQNITPARFSPDATKQAAMSKKIRADLEKIARAVNVEGYARIDAFVRIYNDGRINTIPIEVNSLPGMTPATCIFHQTAINGYKPYDFIDKILEYSLSKTNSSNPHLKDGDEINRSNRRDV